MYIVKVSALTSEGQYTNAHTIPKRYSEFHTLNEQLEAFNELTERNMAGAALPKKKLLGDGTQAALVEERRVQLAVSLLGLISTACRPWPLRDVAVVRRYISIGCRR